MAATLELGDWHAAVRAVLADPERVRPVFQPIFDLQRGVICGFEMLARFDSPMQAAPDRWFAAAERAGLGPELEAVLVAAGMRARDALPENCFLTINVGPQALLSDEVRAVLGRRDLSRVVVEVTEATPVTDYDALLGALAELRAAGALIAVDDAGAGYASLRHVMQIRPDFVKLDRALVTGVDRDPAKHALVEMFGTLAGRLDAWLVAEGLEHPAEREVLATMGVPLAQGFALARPAPHMRADATVPAAAARGGGLSALVSTSVPRIALGAPPPPGLESAVVVDAEGRPLALVTGGRVCESPLCVLVAEDPGDVAQRALTRPRLERFDPICCTDERGRLVGLAPFEQLVRHLATSTERTQP